MRPTIDLACRPARRALLLERDGIAVDAALREHLEGHGRRGDGRPRGPATAR